MQIIVIALLILIVLCETIAQCFANTYRHNNSIIIFLLAVFLYALVIYFLSEAHKHADMGILNGVWSGLSVIVISISGILFFDEKLSNSQLLALLTVATSVGYLSSTMEPKP